MTVHSLRTPAQAAPTLQAETTQSPRAPRSPVRRPAVGPPLLRLRPTPASAERDGLTPEAAERLRQSEGGVPLPLATRLPIERSLGVRLDSARVHDDTGANRAAANMAARAFTYGADIYLGAGQSPLDLGLMAHEAAHVVHQQGTGGPAAQTFTTLGGLNAYEGEAQRAASAVQRGQSFEVTGRTGDRRPQRLPGWLEAAGEGIVSGARWVGGRARAGAEWVGEKVEQGWEYVRDQAWSLLEEYAPRLAEILRSGVQGVFNWIREHVVGAFEALYNRLAAPVRAISGVVTRLREHFGTMVTWITEAAGQIARGDCSAITEAARRIQQVIEGITGPIIEQIRIRVEQVKEFFQAVWDKLSAAASAIWEMLQEVGGWAWEQIQSFFRWIWERTAPIRRLGQRVWNWIKRQIGIADEVDGEGGLLSWLKDRVGAAWEWVKERAAPFIGPLKKVGLVIAGVVVMLSPAGPIIAIGAAVGGILVGIRWLRQNMSQPDSVVQQRGVLEGQIIPGILNAVDRISGAIRGAADRVSAKLNELLEGMGGLTAAIGGSVLRFAVGLLEWLLERFRELANWATQQLVTLANWVTAALNRLRAFLEPVLRVLRRVRQVIADLFNIAALVLGRVWNAIPACIRDPIVNFLVNQILRRLPIFREILSIPDIWEQIRDTAMNVIRQVFVDGDLLGALVSVFRLILHVLRVPVELVTEIFRRADAALDLIARDPLGFLRNVLRALRVGFGMFFENIGTHLLNGALHWLFGQVSNIGITRPPDFTFRSIFTLVIQVLGITLDLVLNRLALRVGRKVVDRIRRTIDILTGAWEWVRVALEEGPAGLWSRLMERLNTLRDNLVQGVVDWIMQTIVVRITARLLTMLDPTGIMAVVQTIITIYRGFQTLMNQLRGVLEIVNSIMGSLLGIARGAVQEGGSLIADALARGIPIMIAFLANQAGLGRIGARIREAVQSVRQRVIAAIDWLIDRAVRLGRGLLNLGQRAVGAVREWWRARFNFRGRDGQAHSLYYDRRAGRYELMVRSNPQNALAFLNAINANTLSPLEQDALRDARRRARRLDNPPADYPNLQEDMQALGNTIAQFFQRPGAANLQNLGTQAKPFPLGWYKPASRNFPDITFKGPNDKSKVVEINGTQLQPGATATASISRLTRIKVNSARLPGRLERIRAAAAQRTQATAPQSATNEQAEEIQRRAGFARDVRRYFSRVVAAHPQGAQTTEITIGLASRYHVAAGTVLGPTTRTGARIGLTGQTPVARDTRIVRTYRDVMRLAGLQNMGSLGIDHVTDLAFGGRDRFDNLWPYADTLDFPPELYVDVNALNLGANPCASLPDEIRRYIHLPTKSATFPRGKYFVIRGFSPAPRPNRCP